ncbi:hypothetical protein Zmor_021010 [Zophobas morio]|uniref:Uncharacterized protein n=1 Tax=Zophobas morio TaxID=2755281 RepID=A0AA38I7H3_9CUCU|nr:hypothetical protein Zmor_021010 [Zophobas morio]
MLIAADVAAVTNIRGLHFSINCHFSDEGLNRSRPPESGSVGILSKVVQNFGFATSATISVTRDHRTEVVTKTTTSESKCGHSYLYPLTRKLSEDGTP